MTLYDTHCRPQDQSLLQLPVMTHYQSLHSKSRSGPQVWSESKEATHWIAETRNQSCRRSTPSLYKLSSRDTTTKIVSNQINFKGLRRTGLKP